MGRNLNLCMEQVKAEIRDILRPIENVSVTEAKDIIGRYTAAVEGNFVPWMAAALIYARSSQGEYAAKENLGVEIRDNHQGMLRDFARCADAEPSLEHYQAVEVVVSYMRVLIREGNGLEALTVMAVLENTSTVFIPHLAELAEKRGSVNFHYTNIHGEADLKRAHQFILAVEHEMKLDNDPHYRVDRAVSTTVSYLKQIF